MSNLKKVLALALALAMVMTMFAGASIKTVLDVKDADQFTDAQLKAAGLLQPLGVLAGTGAEELGAGTVNRAQMVAFIYRLVNGGDAGIDAYYSKTAIYDDVDTEEWYAPYINWAYAAKVAFGYGDNFGPKDPVTGAQAAAMLVRLLGKDASGANYALLAEQYAIGFALDEGIATRGLYENALSRGDMFILLANALMTEVKGTTIAEKIFDLEIIENVILDSAKTYDKVNNKNTYSIFKFHATDAIGKDLIFFSNVLCVEDDADIREDIGCRFTILVSKSQDANGYRHLYAAYEEDEGAYYTVVEGLVDDGALFFKDEGKNKKNVYFDAKCVFYVDNVVSTEEAFKAAYGKRNWATYKLIDNDGDGMYEYAHIEHFAFADLGVTEVAAKVTAIAADGTLTLTAEDGTVYSGIKYGEYWDKNAKAFVENTAEIKFALGIDQKGYLGYTGISDTFYNFSIVYNAEKKTGYVYKVGMSEKTNFTGNYGVLVNWHDWNSLYMDMGYATFVNEANEYFNAYVKMVNETSSYRYAYDIMDKGDDADRKAIANLENALIYFTDADYSDNVVSILTANCVNANQTYNELEAFEWKEDLSKLGQVCTFDYSVWSDLCGKEDFDYTERATYYNDRPVYARNFPDVDNNSWYVGEPYNNPSKKGYYLMPGLGFFLGGNYNNNNHTCFDYKNTAIYAVFSKGGVYQVWDAWNQHYEEINVTYQFTKANNRLLDGLAVTDYTDLEENYLYPVTDDFNFYRIEDLDECIGFVYLKESEITVDFAGLDRGAEQFQIYMANGFWHLRFWSWIFPHDIYKQIKLTTTTPDGKERQLLYTMADKIKDDDENYVVDKFDDDVIDEHGDLKCGGYWYIALPDHNDPMSGIGQKAEFVRLSQVVKGFMDDEFTDFVKETYKSLIDKFSGKPYLSKYTLLDASKGVVFAYGKVAANGDYNDWWLENRIERQYNGGNDEAEEVYGLYRWVAYDVETFNKLFYAFGEVDCDAMIGYDGDEWECPGLCPDELIYTILPSAAGKGIKNTDKFTTVVKAMKVSTDCIELLPYGWMEKAGYELVVFKGFTGAVSTEGWEIELLSLDDTGIASEKVYTKVGLAGAEHGDILLVKRDADGLIVSIEVASNNLLGYLDYIPGGFLFKISSGFVKNDGLTIYGDDIRRNYFEYDITEGKIAVYIYKDAEGDMHYSNTYDASFYKDADGKAEKVTVFTAGNYVFVAEL